VDRFVEAATSINRFPKRRKLSSCIFRTYVCLLLVIQVILASLQWLGSTYRWKPQLSAANRGLSVLLLSMEILVMMALLLLVGSYLLPECPAMAYLFLTWFIFVVLSSVLMAAVCVHVSDQIFSYEVATHFVLWQVICPLIVFQAQVISGYWENLPPILDRPLCSTMLMFDFLACYIFLDSANDVGFEFYYAGQTANQKFLSRSVKSQWEMFMD